ncbi:MAG TPA: pilus assembly PilX N-terminal domain-containing protein [Vicinamibacterales bacterium]|nr:pilus assembly PilX N-terminal domain-containing protein [Vicinamibacterales bacterium]
MHPNSSTRPSTRCARSGQAPLRDRLHDEDGIALIVSLMAMMLLMALGVALVMTTTTETRIAANYSEGTEALYAADAAVERVMDDILTVPDWNDILTGLRQSAFIDGSVGMRDLPDGTKLDLNAATNMLNCAKLTPCGSTDLNEVTDERPWGNNNPQWKLYAYGRMNDMLPTESINSRDYVVVWIADDPSETDENPLKDGDTSTDGAYPKNPGKGVLAMHAEAYGPFGVKRVIEVTVAKTDTTEIERGYTGQRGQDEQNRRARKAAVQTPGKALTKSEMGLTTGGLQ